jgi:pyridoxamine 5'-phosphate oxidase
MPNFKGLADIRRDYGELVLADDALASSPIEQFNIWFAEITEDVLHDPTAMVLSTVDEEGNPDSRVVLLKGIEDGCFVFYTNYQSTKGQQIGNHPYAAANFYWPHMARQVRIRGAVDKVNAQVSDEYFASRPLNSQLSAIASHQSKEVQDRATLERSLNELIAKHGQEPVLRPIHWGGYRIIPDEFEFWQGRDNRLHDRIRYIKQQNTWVHCRLAP